MSPDDSTGPDTGWFLLRAAALVIGDAPTPMGISTLIGDAYVRTTRVFTVGGAGEGLLTVAGVEVQPPTVRDGRLTLPTAALEQAEASLEIAAALLSADRQTTHTVLSPEPCVGFGSDHPELADLDGVVVDTQRRSTVLSVPGDVGLLEGSHVKDLQDRFDGVQLLAEALNQRTHLGEYLQLIRVFERAFRLGPGALASPLADFLWRGRSAWTSDDVQRWMRPRGGAVHADRRAEVYLSRDVRSVVSNMRDAAYDVVMNKRTWRSSDSERRDLWRPRSGSSPRGVFVTQGDLNVQLHAELVDCLGAFGQLLGGSPDEVLRMLPPGMWLRTDDASANTLRLGGGWSVGDHESSETEGP